MLKTKTGFELLSNTDPDPKAWWRVPASKTSLKYRLRRNGGITAFDFELLLSH